MTHEIVCRPAREADVPGLRRLITQSARALSRGYYSAREIEAAVRFVFGVDSQLIADETYFVVERDGVVVGCGGWSYRATLYGGDQRPVGAATRLDPARDPAKIRAFFVAPEAARQGVGRILFTRCVDAARQAGFRSLELMATLPGVPFYSALGFETVEDVIDRVPNGVALRFVRMRRDVPPGPASP